MREATTGGEASSLPQLDSDVGEVSFQSAPIIDAIVTDGISAAFNIQQSHLPLRLVDTPLSTLQKAWAIKKGKPNLVKAINKAIAEGKANINVVPQGSGIMIGKPN